MKKLLLPLLCLACFSCRADVTVEQKIEATTTNGSILTRIKGDMARIDMPASQVGEVSMIVNIKDGEIITLVHGKKVFLKESLEANKKKTEEAQKTAGIDLTKDEVPKTTGQKEKVGDWETEIFEGIVGGNKTKYWIAKDFPNYKEVTAQQNKVVSALGSGSFDPTKNDLGGMIVKSETTLPKDKGKVTKTIVEAKEKPLEDAIFKAPEDFKLLETPKQ